ncbi:MAG: hypothetical protein V8T31_09895 [Lachnospiraceae bacterium]
MFGFNVWTVLDEVMNPNVKYDAEKGGFIGRKSLCRTEVFEMPDGVGPNTLVKVEHEEVVTMAKFLKQYGLKKATFKMSLDEKSDGTALKVMDKLGLRSIHPVQAGEMSGSFPKNVGVGWFLQRNHIGQRDGWKNAGRGTLHRKEGWPGERVFPVSAIRQSGIHETLGNQAVTAQNRIWRGRLWQLLEKESGKKPVSIRRNTLIRNRICKLMDESGYAV